ncbi:3-deoxy-7-phosphoheptulonate synthase [Treponema sp.]|uniref:3-deoxy-7-phosphoheptulonate synthase n=1 Tax=Treponema sp. TaxID=166 RepID=UPI003F0AAAB7
MVIVLKKNSSEEQKEYICSFLKERNFKINEIVGEEDTVIAAVGKVSMDIRELELLPGVCNVIPISKPFKLASREFKKENTVIEIPNNRGQIIRIGGQRIVSIAGPCAVESREQIMETAAAVASSGAVMLRGGAYKPRSSPYSFQGLGEKGLEYLKEAGDKFGLPIVTEIVSESLIPVMKDYVDVYQIGARNMQNFDLLRKVGAIGKPVILKRSYTATLEELLMSAEYLLSSGTDNVILCERGIRTFEHATRNTLDISAVPVLRSLTHLPILVDPSHAVGIREKVPSMGLASIASGADGIIVEVHTHPEKALSDGAQSMLPAQFDKMMHDIEALAPVIGKSVAHIREENFSVVNSPEKKSTGKIVCAYSGKRGAYAEQAISRYFDSHDIEARAVDSFEEIFQSVVDGKADYGMVPIENSLAGSVFQNYDNFTRFEDVSIAGAVTLNIRHALLGVKGASLSGIKNVYSHPQPFTQCKKFLDGHKEWNLIDSVSTATAAQFVSEKGLAENAAIASPLNAPLYNLEILAEDIENDPGNFTRFVVIQANHTAKPSGAGEANVPANMASFIFKTKNEPGALYNVLGVFNDFGLNMTRLESRPITGQPWRYWFYADAQIKNANAPEYVKSLMEKLSEKVEEIRLLGIYSELGK